jgi:hypothetical protein
MTITLDDIKSFKSLVAKPYKENNKILNAMNCFNSLFIYFFITALSIIAFSLLVIFPVFGFESAIFPMISSFLCLYIPTIINLVLINYFDSKKPVNVLARKIKKGIYKGSITDIVDLECEITKAIITPEKEELSQVVFEKKGIPGDIILSLLERIEHEKQKEAAKQKNKEERDALILAETPVGSILKEISEI